MPSEIEADPPLLTVDCLVIEVPGGSKAVAGVSLQIERERSLGLVGESGSGKTLTCRCVLGVLPRGCNAVSGSVRFDGHDLLTLHDAEWRRLYGTQIGAVFQDPASYLNPSIAVGDQLLEVLRVKGGLACRAARSRAVELLKLMELSRPEAVMRQIPSELSGGMQQRVMLAIAVSCDPDLLVADEPTTALDVKTQSEILRLLREMRDRFGLSVLFVSHDLDVVAELSDRIAVFYSGHIVEQGETEQIIKRPQHPYTRTLLEASSLEIDELS